MRYEERETPGFIRQLRATNDGDTATLTIGGEDYTGALSTDYHAAEFRCGLSTPGGLRVTLEADAATVLEHDLPAQQIEVFLRERAPRRWELPAEAHLWAPIDDGDEVILDNYRLLGELEAVDVSTSAPLPAVRRLTPEVATP